MSVFGNIMNAIFGSKSPEAVPGATAAAPSGTSPAASPAPGAKAAAPSGKSSSASPAPAPGAKAAAPSGTSPSAAPAGGVDVEAVLTKMAEENDEDLNWRKSIVDLMKLLDLDSSLAARKELAKELGYKGALNGSAEMNIWLHKQVMVKLAENGGKVPDSLKA